MTNTVTEGLQTNRKIKMYLLVILNSDELEVRNVNPSLDHPTKISVDSLHSLNGCVTLSTQDEDSRLDQVRDVSLLFFLVKFIVFYCFSFGLEMSTFC